MKQFAASCFFVAMVMPVCAELPDRGFRAVSGGSSPDGRWIVCVLDSSGTEFIDQLPVSHHTPYLIDLDGMRAVAKFENVTTLGGYHGRPETNVTAKWFPDSKHVAIGWRAGRLNHGFSLFQVSPAGVLRKIGLPDPLKQKASIFNGLAAHSNCGNYLGSIRANGELVVVYYGFWPKDDAFFKTEQGKGFDRNRIEVVFKEVGDEWVIKSAASPGAGGDQGSANQPTARPEPNPE